MPVSKRKCLFEASQEAKNHYLETMSSHEMFHQMLVGSNASAYETLASVDGSASLVVEQRRTVSSKAVVRLDQALEESQLVLACKDHDERAKALETLQVACEMALHAC